MQAQARFDALVADIRPELHRYCARMMGSVVDGEDVVQETLARAYYTLSMMTEVPRLRPWLFRIAHNKAIDYLRGYERRHAQPLADLPVPSAEDVPLEQREAAALAMSLYTQLTPLQRGAVILKDVLGYSLAEISEILDSTVAAIKAALHRGRARLRTLAAQGLPEAPAHADAAQASLLQRYVDSFNARDWAALRDMLADDVRLDLVGRAQRVGATQVGNYFSNYDKKHDWRLQVGRVEGRLAVVARDPASGDDAPTYFALVDFDDAGLVNAIRDFRYARYVMTDARVDG
ncbi:sigma-70 family RNA polymerase sigma factor [Haliangium sp.]|uniref:sigma-70 family RNA polymerase sigma factor n=1 Tax=Haliangium sp. TaxID=2663208 RepID=UPI003D0F2565